MASMLKVVLVGCVLIAIAADGNAAEDKNNCTNAYKSTLDRLRRKQLSAERFAALSRRALRIYDACQTGDMEGATSFFENLERWKN
jgi:hypothetical protein